MMQDTGSGIANDSGLPKFTFSLPTYNAAEFLERCLASIFSQDYPKDKIEVMISDGGSSDNTLEIARKYAINVFPNPKKLADFGAKINVANSTGDLLVIFAADNELVGKDWLQTIAEIFMTNKELACMWCDMAADPSDPPINRYYELIKSDPLMFSVNKNLKWYLQNSEKKHARDISFHIFDAMKDRPLVWGANGLVYRMDCVKHIILQEGFVGDNDVFQTMIDEGNNKLAFSEDLQIYHHHLKNFGHWVSKWKRNYQDHLVSQLETRNMRWMMVRNFRAKVALWSLYSIIPVFSGIHSLFLMIKDRNAYWAYHPIACFAQAVFLLRMTLGSSSGRRLLKA